MFDSLVHRYLRVPYTLHIYRESTVKKARATIVFLHGLGNTGKTWDEVAAEMPDDVNLYIVDLLGFGDSPQPDWAVYSAPTQARSLAQTLLPKLLKKQQVILVGHSMGGLVAVEFAKRYAPFVDSLILCSPPIYNVDSSDDKKLFAERDEQLRRLYEFAIKKPENIVRFSKIAKRYGLMNADFDVDTLNVDSYISALRANVLSQTTVRDIVSIKKPIQIVYGTLDPFVIAGNYKKASEKSSFVTTKKFLGSHEVMGRYVKQVIAAITEQIESGTN